LPFVPGKTLTGIWRDACERVALGLDDGAPGAWSRWIPFLLAIKPDSPTRVDPTPKDQWRPAARRVVVSAARFAKELRGALKAKPAAREAATLLCPACVSSAVRALGTSCLRFGMDGAPALSCTQMPRLARRMGRCSSTARPPHCVGRREAGRTNRRKTATWRRPV